MGDEISSRDRSTLLKFGGGQSRDAVGRGLTSRQNELIIIYAGLKQAG